MEKHRTSVISRSEKFIYHPRKTLDSKQTPVQYYRLHEYLDGKRIHLQHNQENLIIDIHLATPNEKAQKLQIKHITGEK